ncbi:MAG: hypothetical protein ACI80V_001144 [Rhodothermales bacterium]|jgi:hypothetical protein
MKPTRLLLLCLLLTAAPSASAQVVGTVWDPPADNASIVADLAVLVDLKMGAVRLPHDRPRWIIQAADTLGIAVYLEIAADFLTTAQLADSAGYLSSQIAAIGRGVRPAAVGLGYAPQTSDPETCRLLSGLSESSAVPTYIVSWARAPDPCSSSVDFVIYDGPLHRGRGVLGEEASQDPHAQASLLVSRLEASLRGQPQGPVFIHRLRDQRAPDAFRSDPGNPAFGLLAASGSPRPAASAVREALGVGKFVVDRPPATHPKTGTSTPVVVGWAIILTMLIAWARSPRFWPTVARYFAGHGFYRNAVRDGRDSLILVAGLVMVSVGAASGMIVARFSEVFVATRIFHIWWAWMSPAGRSFADGLSASGGRLGVFVALVVIGLSLMWLVVLHVAFGRRRGMKFVQLLVLVTMPRWLMLALVPFLMLSVGLQQETLTAVAPAFVALWLISAVWGPVRATIDISNVARVPLPLALLGLLASPPAAALYVLIVFLTSRPGALRYLLGTALI